MSLSPRKHSDLGTQNPPPELRRRKGDIPPEQMAITISWGERLLPYLYIAMESCWIYAILLVLPRINVFRSSGTLLPLWGLFVLFAGSYFFTHMIEQRQLRRTIAQAGGKETMAETRGSLWIFALVVLLALFVTWGSVYVDSYLLFDPRWLGSLLNDLLSLTPQGFWILSIWGIAIYFCWRGLKLSRRTIEPGDVMRGLRIGTVLIILALLVTAPTQSQAQGAVTRLLLIPLFLALALMTHALARAVSMRNEHAVGLQGGAAAQERSLLLLIGSVSSFLLLIAFILGFFVSPAVLKDFQQTLAPLGAAYDWLVEMLVWLVILIVSPIVWLLSLLHPGGPTVQIKPPSGVSGVASSKVTPESIIVLSTIFKVVLPLVFIALVALAIFWFVRRKRSVMLRKRAVELHESLWSWTLFRAQLAAIFRAIWKKLFGKKVKVVEESAEENSLSGPATIRGIREVYRAFLKWAAQRGIPRKRYETPDEFQQRLLAQYPQHDRELQTLTDAYTTIRYGALVPDEQELRQVEQDWKALQQNV